MRQVDDRVGRITLEELKRGGVIGPDGGLGYSEGYGAPLDEDDDDEDDSELEDEKPIIDSQPDRRSSTATKGKGKGLASAQATPLLPRAKRSSKRSLPPPTTPGRGGGPARPPQTTPGGSNFSDLLRAAEMATRPGTPARDSSRVAHVPMSTMSATRSTTRAREGSTSEKGSPTKRARRDPPPSASWSRGRRISGMEVQEEGDEELEHPPVDFSAADPAESKPADSQQSHPEAFALDLLAQASQLDVAQTDSQGSGMQLESAARFEGMLEEGELLLSDSPPSSPGGIGLAPPIDLKDGLSNAPDPIEDYQIDPALSGLPRPGTGVATPRPRPRGPSFASDIHTPARTYHQQPYPTPDNAYDDTPGRGGSPPCSSRNEMLSHELPPGAFASPTGATVPGLGKYVHLTSSMPARRVRSPYLKWTVEEVGLSIRKAMSADDRQDELLARAVAIHGEKWDLVSKGVPTRSYHQVRQRSVLSHSIDII